MELDPVFIRALRLLHSTSKDSGPQLKAMLDECKKVRTCPCCGAHNGTVKKKPGESLKIIHDRYSVTKDNELDDLVKRFDHSCAVNPEIEKSLKDTVEELDPLKV